MSEKEAQPDPFEGFEWGSVEWVETATGLDPPVQVGFLEGEGNDEDGYEDIWIPWKDKRFMSTESKKQFPEDVAGYMKKIRQEILGLTMEGLAEIMGISKGHIAKIEGGKVIPTTTLDLMFWDIVERVLRNKGLEWVNLPPALDIDLKTGLEAVDQLVSDGYKSKTG